MFPLCFMKAPPRCPSRYLFFHAWRSASDFCKATRRLKLAGKCLFYRASSETSQNLNNRTSLCMSAREECWRSAGMQPGNYSHLRQLSPVFSRKPAISQLLTLAGTALTAPRFPGRWLQTFLFISDLLIRSLWPVLWINKYIKNRDVLGGLCVVKWFAAVAHRCFPFFSFVLKV